ncbi:MAG TPA: hypothetical protein VKD66_18775 [Streptosporangiaceae bacterium]|nr:hypothetical protein [Streptosporangiaceae bacterium]
MVPRATTRNMRRRHRPGPYYLEDSVPAIFAVGDVRAGSVKQLASPVGEGAMATQLLRRCLEAR